MSWLIRGRYFESCNCDAICPCRTIDGLPGRRSTHGECLGVLSWVIEEGHADDVSLDGLKVAFATPYHDDEPGSPWTFVMYVDAGADAARRARGHLHGPARRRCAGALPVGVEAGGPRRCAARRD